MPIPGRRIVVCCCSCALAYSFATAYVVDFFVADAAHCGGVGVSVNQGVDCPGLNCLEWEAHPGSHVLGAFWLRGASSERNLVTANPPGEIRWWRLPDSFQANDEAMKGTEEEPARPALVAEAHSPFRKRIRCVDCDTDNGILAAGDQKGNVIVFQRQARPWLTPGAQLCPLPCQLHPECLCRHLLVRQPGL